MSAKNMVAMLGVMAMMRRIDQEEPIVLRYARLGFVLHILFTAAIYTFLHYKITSRRDATILRVPKKSKTPSFTETFQKAAEKAERDRLASSEQQSTNSQDTNTDQQDNSNNNNEEEEMETITVMEYDLRHLANARRSWITNACLLSAVHYKMESVSPLIITPLMGTLRLLTDDPLIQIHILGSPAVGRLQRPFKPEVSPLQNMLKELAPKEGNESQQQQDSTQNESSTTTTQTNNNSNTAPVEELHDDGDSDDDEDGAPRGIADLADDHIKGDFDDDQNVDQEPKKTK